MATTLIDWRPSALRAVCSPVVSARLASVMAQPLGRPVAATVVRTESVFGLVPAAAVLPGAESFGTVKINKYIGTPAAAPTTGVAVAGAAMSSRVAMASGEIRNQQLGDDIAKGTDARGIPPRGRRSV
ncbi:MAG: hypothetical protein IRY85_20615 [Micromonosporaceae bacterium]|nr:hypothetical protein [Micromonosporaceae bacterium]